MVTLAKLCLVMTVVLGLAFAEPRPVWRRTEREQDTGDECREMGTACSEDQECCSSHCKLQCQKSLGGKCYRKCSDCKHLNDICHTNDDCCSNKCAPDRLDPYAPHTCTDEEPSQESYKQHSYKMMAADTGDLENQGEMGGLYSRSEAKASDIILECPSIAHDLTGDTFLRIPDVMSWSQCGDICATMTETVCQYWTWEKPAHMCHVKKDMGTALPERAGRTSGKRGCVEKE